MFKTVICLWIDLYLVHINFCSFLKLIHSGLFHGQNDWYPSIILFLPAHLSLLGSFCLNISLLLLICIKLSISVNNNKVIKFDRVNQEVCDAERNKPEAIINNSVVVVVIETVAYVLLGLSARCSQVHDM